MNESGKRDDTLKWIKDIKKIKVLSTYEDNACLFANEKNSLIKFVHIIVIKRNRNLNNFEKILRYVILLRSKKNKVKYECKIGGKRMVKLIKKTFMQSKDGFRSKVKHFDEDDIGFKLKDSFIIDGLNECMKNCNITKYTKKNNYFDVMDLLNYQKSMHNFIIHTAKHKERQGKNSITFVKYDETEICPSNLKMSDLRFPISVSSNEKKLTNAKNFQKTDKSLKWQKNNKNDEMFKQGLIGMKGLNRDNLYFKKPCFQNQPYFNNDRTNQYTGREFNPIIDMRFISKNGTASLYRQIFQNGIVQYFEYDELTGYSRIIQTAVPKFDQHDMPNLNKGNTKKKFKNFSNFTSGNFDLMKSRNFFRDTIENMAKKSANGGNVNKSKSNVDDEELADESINIIDMNVSKSEKCNNKILNSSRASATQTDS
ncbi:hypothetical protein A3Q56_02697 [Intoshia linei]|uniref:Uncharacterized protein n=1 Tax=Intoshia linei TaxID=1819745 RepID=A0A177B5M4_9BILA|nr:hypothetical protein A3Q56_02697 [Intoshia linei]